MDAQNPEGEYNYEAERKKLKLGPIATCVLLFKTTVGVGVFTYQYAYAKVQYCLLVRLFARHIAQQCGVLHDSIRHAKTVGAL